jgi:L-lactate dehydrogenase complex protein LldG
VVAVAVTTAREEILARVAAATRGAEPPPPPPAAPAPRRGDPRALASRIDDYGATVSAAADEDAVAAVVAAILARHEATRIAIPTGLPTPWRPTGVELIEDEPRLEAPELAALDGALTGAELAIARTGTIVLTGGPDQGRRALSLLPDLHVCVVRTATVLEDVEDAIAACSATTSPITFISGPSATSDIELDRVEGVHGPRRLEVVLLG